MTDKGRAWRWIFDGLCELMGEDGRRAKKAVEEIGETVGEEGRDCLKNGDLVGCAIETTRNARRRRRRDKDEE